MESVSSERKDELFYEYLLSVAPPNQRGIITTIRDDERKHAKLFREIYWEATGQDIPQSPETGFVKMAFPPFAVYTILRQKEALSC